MSDSWNVPIPHTHHYDPEFDEEEQRLLAYWSGLQSPLHKTDDL
jgi:hypothetical protein